MEDDIRKILNCVFAHELAPTSGTLDIMKMIREDKADGSSWEKWDPPMDGTKICAMGRIVSTDETGGSSRPFCAIVHWFNGKFGSGWFDENNMAMQYEWRDEVHIDHWIALPEEG